MQALAERLDKPREPRPIKDISSDALVKCPIEKCKDEMHEWAMALAAAASGLCEMIMMVMARDVSVLGFADQTENVQADRWLARQINASIKEDTEAGKLFHKEARQNAAICRSGVRFLDKVYKTVTKSNPLKLDLAEQKMATTVYFTGGMTIDQTKLAAAQFKSDHAELGSRRSQDELTVYKAMLKELPPALHEPLSTVVRDLLWEMEESSMNSEPLIAYDKLVTKMAIMLRNVHGAAKKSKEVNSTALSYVGAAKGKGKGKGASKGAAYGKGKGAKGAPGKGSGAKEAPGITCAVCGKANVLTSACTCPPCVRCKFRFCPGAPGARAITGLGCVFDMLKYPEHRLVVQANGPIPKSLYEKSAREYAKWWGVPLEASAAEASSTDLDEAHLRLHVWARAPPTGHFFRNVAGQLNGQLLRFVATRNQQYSTPTRSYAFLSLVWYPRHRSNAQRTCSARPRAPLLPLLMVLFYTFLSKAGRLVLSFSRLYPSSDFRVSHPDAFLPPALSAVSL